MKPSIIPTPSKLLAFVAANAVLLVGTLHAQWTGVGAGGAGNDFNSTTNWIGGTINGSFISNNTTSTILLSANQATTGGLTFFNSSTPTQPIVTTIDGTAGGSLEVLTINGNVTANRSAALAPSTTANWASGSSTINVSSAAGLVVGQALSGGFGLVPGTVITGISGTNVSISLPTYSAQTSSVTLGVGSGVILGSNLQLALGSTTRFFKSDAGSGSVAGVITVDALVSGTHASGTSALRIDGGTLVLNNSNNTFSGFVRSAGSGLINFSSAGALGTGTAIDVNNSALAYVGTGALSLNRAFTNVNSGIFNNNSSGGASSAITFDGNIGLSGGNLTLGGANKAATNVINASITGGGELRVGSGISGDGTGAIWRIASTNNNHTGVTAVHAGTLEFLTIGNVGGATAHLAHPRPCRRGPSSWAIVDFPP